jgi:two-component system, NarL family, sensor histidine kinase UhpB
VSGGKEKTVWNMRESGAAITHWRSRGHLSLFEQVILLNSALLLVEALIGVWITSHELESHHYLIDTLFIVVATLCTISINVLAVRATFRPLFHLLEVIRAVSAGNTQARAVAPPSSWEIQELAQAFNAMLDRLAGAQREQTLLMLQAQEDERRRISLELHDEAGQNLSALLIHVDLLARHVQQQTQSGANEHIPQAIGQHLSNEIAQLNSLTQMTLENVRVLAQQLRPAVLDDLGLLAALRWLVEDSSQRLHLHVELDIKDPVMFATLPSAHEVALFRIAQESLTHVARHAHTEQAHLSLWYTPDTLHLRVRDEGCGYTIDTSAKPLSGGANDTMNFINPGGNGLTGMRSRIHALGGNFSVASRIGKGTTIEVSVPWTPAQSA